MHQEQCFMYRVSYPSLLMTSLSGLLVLDSRSPCGELFSNSTFKGGPSESMIGNFRHNLHIISIKIDVAANTGGFWCAFLQVQGNPSSRRVGRAGLRQPAAALRRRGRGAHAGGMRQEPRHPRSRRRGAQGARGRAQTRRVAREVFRGNSIHLGVQVFPRWSGPGSWKPGLNALLQILGNLSTCPPLLFIPFPFLASQGKPH